jgi:glycosyltransferase involved in cell wall biosynthesis
MITLCVLTYYPENLLVSLSRLRNYRDYPFKLLIHNDNPAENVTVDYVQGILNRPDVHVFVHNNEKNMAHFNSRMNVIKLMKDNPDIRSKWFIFIDDDDVLLRPKLIDGYAPVLNQNALVVRRLREVLSLIRDPDYYPGRSEFMQEEKPKDGCVGIPYDTQTYFEFYDKIQGFLPTLYQIYGSERVMEPDDVILMYMFRIFLEDKLGLSCEEMPEYMARFAQDSYSYALTYLEDRRGRYETTPGVVDLRYGRENPTGMSYESLYFAISDAFYEYLGTKYIGMK